MEISIIIPTLDRSDCLRELLEGLFLQTGKISEIIIVDASAGNATRDLINQLPDKKDTTVKYVRARKKGAAVQRQQAMEHAQGDAILFMDDDIVPVDGHCLENLSGALTSHLQAGGVNALIENPIYHKPGKISKTVYDFLHGRPEASYAGKCIGPAVNFLPDDDKNLPIVNEVMWLNTTCTLYRRIALPSPLFPGIFQGYSFMEDMALSLEVAKRWKLFNVRSARVLHNSRPAAYKSNQYLLSRMELVNRFFIVSQVLGKNDLASYFKLLIYELFAVASGLKTRSGLLHLVPVLAGKLSAVLLILTGYCHRAK